MLRPLLLALALTACTSRHVKDARSHVAAGDWVAAHAAWSRALADRPSNVRVAAQAADARLRALDQLHDRYEAAFPHDLPTAFHALVDAHPIGPDQPWIDEGFDAVLAARLARFEAALAGSDDDAYRLAVQTAQWYPDAPDAQAALLRIRDRTVARVRAHVAADAFLEAHDAIARIEAHEPTQHTLIQQLSGEVDGAWSAWARDAAATATRRGRHADAFAWAAVARDRADTPADRAMLATLRRRFIDLHGLQIDLAIRGPDARARPMRQHLADAVGSTPGVRWQSDATRPTLEGTIQLDAPQCRQTSTSRPARHTYVAGVVQVPNPEHVRLVDLTAGLRQRLRSTRRELQGQAALLADARAELEFARAAAVPLERRRVAEQRQLEAAVASQQTAIRALEDAEDAAAEVRRHVRRRTLLDTRIRELQRAEQQQIAALRDARGALAAQETTAPKSGPRPERPSTGRPATPRPGGAGPVPPRPPATRPPRPTPQPAPDADDADGADSPEDHPIAHLEAALAATRAALATARADRTGLVAPSPLVQRLAAEVPQRQAALAREDLAGAERRYARAERALQEATDVVQHWRTTVTREARTHDALRREADGLQAEVAQARQALAATSPTLGQEVMDVHAYTIEQWTRSCAVRATLTTRPGALPALSREVTSRWETADETFPAVPSVGLQGDPLRFPHDDRTLVQSGDTAIAEQLVPVLAETVDAWRTLQVQAGNTADRPDPRTRHLVAAWLVDPDRPVPGLQDHLLTTYGLTDPALLLR
jgi:hypothetical protein